MLARPSQKWSTERLHSCTSLDRCGQGSSLQENNPKQFYIESKVPQMAHKERPSISDLYIKHEYAIYLEREEML